MLTGCASSDVLDLVGRMQRASSLSELRLSIEFALREYGVDRFILVGIAPRSSDDGSGALIASRWPLDFVADYVREQMHRDDPLLKRALRDAAPLAWTSADYVDGPEAGAAAVMRRASDYGLRDGLLVPVHGPRGFHSAIGMSAPPGGYDESARFALGFLGICAAEQVFRRTSDDKPVPPITVREREVLTWTALGKSAWEVGEILSISKRTVDKHVQTAFRKLGASNKVHAVAIALRDGIINL